MQRALSARTSVLSAASKRTSFYKPAGLNLQQQRFAHKVRLLAFFPVGNGFCFSPSSWMGFPSLPGDLISIHPSMLTQSAIRICDSVLRLVLSS